MIAPKAKSVPEGERGVPEVPALIHDGERAMAVGCGRMTRLLTVAVAPSGFSTVNDWGPKGACGDTAIDAVSVSPLNVGEPTMLRPSPRSVTVAPGCIPVPCMTIERVAPTAISGGVLATESPVSAGVTSILTDPVLPPGFLTVSVATPTDTPVVLTVAVPPLAELEFTVASVSIPVPEIVIVAVLPAPILAMEHLTLKKRFRSRKIVNERQKETSRNS